MQAVALNGKHFYFYQTLFFTFGHNMFTGIQNKLKECLQATLNEYGNITNVKPVGGGSINATYSFSCAGLSCFVKINDAGLYPEMFEKEAAGLKLLKEHSSFVIPEVILLSQTEKKSFMVLSYLEKSAEGEQYWEQLGRGLAKQHKVTDALFGLDHDNYMGSLKQSNKQQETFTGFFITQRIEPLLAKALDKKYLGREITRNFENLFRRLDEIIPPEQPAFLHRDLGNGN